MEGWVRKFKNTKYFFRSGQFIIYRQGKNTNLKNQFSKMECWSGRLKIQNQFYRLGQFHNLSSGKKWKLKNKNVFYKIEVINRVENIF